MDITTAPTTGVRDAQVLGRVLAAARKDAGLTQAQMADILGVFRDQLSRIEQGKATQQLDLVFQIIRELGLAMRIERP